MIPEQENNIFSSTLILVCLKHCGYTVLYLIFQLKSDPKKFFQNRLKEQKIRMKNSLASRGSVMSRYRWEMRPTEINAYYSPQSNKIGEYMFTLNDYIVVRHTATDCA